MAEQYFLYTVTGLREPFYAAVDHDTGRAWTSPTKDGAIRQARDEGIEGFIERTITREKFLRSLGIEAEPVRRISREQPAKHDPEPETPKPLPVGSWFVTDAHAVDDDSNGKGVSFPPRLKLGNTSKPKSGSPFAGSEIAPPSGDIVADPEDVLIIPSASNRAGAPNPFTDAPPPTPDIIESDISKVFP